LAGSQLGVVREDGAHRMLLGRFKQWPGAQYAAWAPGGRAIGVVDGRGCDVQCARSPQWLVDARTGARRFLAPDCVNASFAPGGSRITCWRYLGFDPSNDRDITAIYAFRAGSRDGRRLASGLNPRWSPRGDEIFYLVRRRLRAIHADGSNIR